MNLRSHLAGAITGSLLIGLAAVASAAPAAATDEGPYLDGQIFFLANAGGFPANTAADVVTSGDGNTRPFQSLTVDATCPATAQTAQASIRIPQVGVVEENWAQVPITAMAPTAAGSAFNADGTFWTARSDYLDKSEVLSYLSSHSGAGEFPVIVACRTALGVGVGTFRTTIAMTGTTTDTLQWSMTAPTYPLPASSTTLVASDVAIESGDAVTLTATVDPAAATGDVEFFAGSVSLGSAAVVAGVATLDTAALPVGTVSVTASYLGGSHRESTSAPVSIEVAPVAARSTTTTLVVDPVSGPAYSPVALTATVTASTGSANGTVVFKDGATTLGSVPVTAGVVPVFTTNVLNAGDHSLTAEFVGTAPYSGSTSAPVAATYTLVGAVDEQTVTVSIPQGAITITSPYTPDAPLALGNAVLDTSDSTYSASGTFSDIVITDTRAGNMGFTASVVSSPFVNGSGASFPGAHAGLTDLVATQVVGNAMLASEVDLTDRVPFTDGLGVQKVFATYPAGQPLGTVDIDGVFGVDQVPTSVTPGLYTATVTFTAV